MVHLDDCQNSENGFPVLVFNSLKWSAIVTVCIVSFLLLGDVLMLFFEIPFSYFHALPSHLTVADYDLGCRIKSWLRALATLCPHHI